MYAREGGKTRRPNQATSSVWTSNTPSTHRRGREEGRPAAPTQLKARSEAAADAKGTCPDSDPSCHELTGPGHTHMHRHRFRSERTEIRSIGGIDRLQCLSDNS